MSKEKKKYTKAQFLLAAEMGEVSMIDAKHVVSLLDEVLAIELLAEKYDIDSEIIVQTLRDISGTHN